MLPLLETMTRLKAVTRLISSRNMIKRSKEVITGSRLTNQKPSKSSNFRLKKRKLNL